MQLLKLKGAAGQTLYIRADQIEAIGQHLDETSQLFLVSSHAITVKQEPLEILAMLEAAGHEIVIFEPPFAPGAR